jgi:hypothetical protein
MLSPLFVRAIRPMRVRRQRRREGVREVEVRNLENLADALERDQGILITSNHAAHADPFVFLVASDQVRRPFHYIVAWQSFQILPRLDRRVLRRHGCFTIDREGNDVRAFRQAVEIVARSRHPLVIFAEGEVYHHNEEVVPFRKGAAAIALTAARRAERPVVCVPAAIRYRYVEDPTPELHRLMDVLEQKLLWRPRPKLPLAERIVRFTAGLLALRELEYLGLVQDGPISARLGVLIEALLKPLEERYGAPPAEDDVPDRVTRLRRLAIKQKESWPASDSRSEQAQHDLDRLYTVTQFYSYLGDHACEASSLEHLAEIVDKYEEDVLGVTTARARGARRGILTFGEPVEVGTGAGKKEDVRALTGTLEQKVRTLLEASGRQ